MSFEEFCYFKLHHSDFLSLVAIQPFNSLKFVAAGVNSLLELLNIELYGIKNISIGDVEADGNDILPCPT